MTRRRYARWRNPFGLAKQTLIARLESYQRSHAMPNEVRDAIGMVLARVETIDSSDLAAMLQLVHDVSYRTASIEDVIAAAKVAFWFSAIDHGKRSA